MKALAKLQFSPVHPFLPTTAAPFLMQVFVIFMKCLCPHRSIFLTIKLIQYRQLRITKSRIKSLMIIVNILMYLTLSMHIFFFF